MSESPLSIEIRTARGSRLVLLRPGRPLTVGSRPDTADIVIEHEPGLDGHHLTLLAEGGIVTIEDAGTAGGTFVNGKRIRRRELREGDTAVAAGVTVRRALTATSDKVSPPEKISRPASAPQILARPRPEAPPTTLPKPATEPQPQPGKSATLSAGGITITASPAYEPVSFRKSPGEHLFAILDLARDRRIHKAILIHPDKFECLYEGDRAIQFSDVGPYLIEFDPDSQLFGYLRREGWGNSWGVFLISSEPFPDIRRHLRRFLMVHLPDGAEAYFRFYDPRVLRSFLPVCTHEQASELFAAVSAFVTESEKPEIAERFEFKGKPNPAFLPPLNAATRGLRGI